MRILRWTAAIGTGLVLAGLPVLAAGALVLTADTSLSALRGGSAGAADAVVGLCAVVGAVALAWLSLAVLLATADELRARRPLRAGARRRPVHLTPGVPVVVRRLVALVVGVLLGSAALSATAAERGAAVAVPQVGWAATAPVAPVDPGWSGTPGWSGIPLPHEPVIDVPPTADRSHGDELVVLRGDTLWSLAEQRCGPQASPAEVLAEQQRLYTANAEVIGDDPDLLLPGQVLRLP